ncbi:MAG: ribosome recycling factor [Candidatus Saccharimonas sp.]
MFDTDPYELKMTQTLEHFEEELKTLRTGRAHIGMLDMVTVEVYGQTVPLKQAANVTAPEAQLLQITPFDPSTLQAIVVAIRDNKSLDLNPSDDGRIVRVAIPALTEERRKLMVKQASERAEEARIALRNARQDGLKDAKRMKEAKELSEDDMKLVEKEFDRLIQEFQQKIESIADAKEQDILKI